MTQQGEARGRRLRLRLGALALGVAFSVAVVAMIVSGGRDAPDGSGLARRAPFVDSGSATDLASVREALPQLVDLRLSAGRVPPEVVVAGPDAMRRYVDSPGEKARRADALRNSLTADDAVSSIPTVEAGLREAVEPEHPGWIFTDNRFEVLEWQGIRIDGDTATVMVRSVQKYRSPASGWQSEPEEQATFTLLRSPGSLHGWLIRSEAVHDTNGAG